MALSTFADIKAAVASSLARSDVPAFVYSLAHAEVVSRFRVREMEITGALAVTGGSIYVTLPTGFKVMRHAYIGGDGTIESDGSFSDGFSDGFETEITYSATVYTKLDQASGANVSDAFLESGTPQAFAIVGTDTGPKMRLDCVPDADRSIVYTAVLAPAEPTADTDTNLLMSTFPSAYLYSSLRHAAIWAQDVELAQVYTAAYEGEAARIVKQDRVTRYSGPLAARIG
jgi:hypothetical protein